MTEGLWSKTWNHEGRALLSVAVFVSAAVITGCGGVPKTHYYTVAMPALTPVNDPKTSFVLDVERFRAPEVLRDDRILYYQSATELNFYEYHRWTAAPADMTADLVARRLKGADIFREVRLFPHSKPGDFVLRGHLLNFEEVDYQSGGAVRVGLELALVRTRDHQVIWTDRRLATRGLEGKGVEGVVKSLNDATGQLLNEFLPALSAEVERESERDSQKSK